MKCIGSVLFLVTTAVVLTARTAEAFVSPPVSVSPGGTAIRPFIKPTTTFVPMQERMTLLPASFKRQRRSVASVQTMSLFGIGAPELILILVAVALLVGPEALANMAKSSGKAIGEQLGDKDDVVAGFQQGFQDGLNEAKESARDIKSEFEKGMEEGEINARARNAKKMSPVPPKEDDKKANDVE